MDDGNQSKQNAAQHSETKPNSGRSDSGKLRRSLSIATVIMTTSVLLSRVTGLAREMVFAQLKGTSTEMDAYVTAFIIPDLLNHFLAGGFLTVTFIPIFQTFLAKNDRDGAWRIFSNLLSTGSVLFALLIPLAMVFTPAFVGKLGAHISDNPETFALTVRLTRIILPAQICFYWGGFFSAVQMAEHRFFLPALAPLCYNGGIIAGGLFLGPIIGIEGFAWGVLAGAFIGNFLIQLPGIIRLGVRFLPHINLSDPNVGRYIRLTLPLVLGVGMTFSNEIFFRYFASFLDRGATSSINYGLRTFMIIVGVFGQAAGVAFYPYLSRFVAEGKLDKMAALLQNTLHRIALLVIPFSGLMIVLAPEIIGILYQRGEFGAAATQRTASVLAIYSFGAFGFSASMIVSRSFYAMQRTVLPMVVSTIVAIISVPFYLWFSSLLGAQGIALAAVTGMTIQFLVIYIIWHQVMAKEHLKNIPPIHFTKILLIGIMTSAVCMGIKQLLLHFNPGLSGFFRNLIVASISATVAVGFLFGLYECVGFHQFRDIIQQLLRRRNRQRS